MNTLPDELIEAICELTDPEPDISALHFISSPASGPLGAVSRTSSRMRRISWPLTYKRIRMDSDRIINGRTDLGSSGILLENAKSLHVIIRHQSASDIELAFDAILSLLPQLSRVSTICFEAKLQAQPELTNSWDYNTNADLSSSYQLFHDVVSTSLTLLEHVSLIFGDLYPVPWVKTMNLFNIWRLKTLELRFTEDLGGDEGLESLQGEDGAPWSMQRFTLDVPATFRAQEWTTLLCLCAPLFPNLRELHFRSSRAYPMKDVSSFLVRFDPDFAALVELAQSAAAPCLKRLAHLRQLTLGTPTRSTNGYYGGFIEDSDSADEGEAASKSTVETHRENALLLQEEWVAILSKELPQLQTIRFGDYFYASNAHKFVPGLAKYFWCADSFNTRVFRMEEDKGVNVFQQPAQITAFSW